MFSGPDSDGGRAAETVGRSGSTTTLCIAPGFMDLEGNAYTYKQALADVRYYLPFINEDGKNFGTHSFRIGLATEAAIVEIPDSAVRLLGRWDSDCFRIYMQTPQRKIAEFAARLSGV